MSFNIVRKTRQMGKDARKYTQMTLKRLFALSRNECAFPGCEEKLTDKESAINSNICHIEAANADGERYNPAMKDSERADYQNLILLCPKHHFVTNDVEKYTVTALKKMKESHESEQLFKRMAKNPSMLKNAIDAIASFDFNNLGDVDSLVTFKPEEKIAYNELKLSVPLIREYIAYHAKIDSLYNVLDSEGSIKKERLLQNIRSIYLSIKGTYVGSQRGNDLEIIRLNSDTIFEDVYVKLLEEMEGSSYWEEDLIFSIHLIMVDAFIRCKILEEPK